MPQHSRLFNIKKKLNLSINTNLPPAHVPKPHHHRHIKHSNSFDSYFIHEELKAHQQKHPMTSPGHELKYIEKSIDSARSRIVTPYQDNHSAALTLPVTDEKLSRTITHPSTLLALSKDYIKEHAARRVDLFFYTLVAYFNTETQPALGSTRLQHGVGRHSPDFFRLTAACHSSLSPGILDETIQQNHDDSTPSYDIDKSILSHTHFMDNLNSTVELPMFVNDLDHELENAAQCREESMMILKKVAQGLNPIEGLQQFLIMMQNAFADIEEKKPLTRRGTPYLLRDSAESPQSIKHNLIALQKHGTFFNKWNASSQSVENPYINLLLRLTPDEIAKCEKYPNRRDKIYRKKILALQQEILTTKTDCDYTAYATKRMASRG